MKQDTDSIDIPQQERASTGIPGLDDILGGGLPSKHLYLIEGSPGSGKTTLGLQFLRRGAQDGEKGLYITLSETATELRTVAASHGWSLNGRGGVRAGDGRGAEPRVPAVDPASVRGGAGRNHARCDGRRRAPEADPGGVRQPVRNAAAGSEPAALSPAGAGAEGLLRQLRLHRPAAGRPQRRPRRPATAQHRARRDQPGAAGRPVRPRATPLARGEDARHPVPRRRARLQPRDRRAGGIPAAGRGRTPRRAGDAPRSAPARPSSTICWAAAWRAAPAPCSAALPASARRPPRSPASARRWSAASGPPTICSTRAWALC